MKQQFFLTFALSLFVLLTSSFGQNAPAENGKRKAELIELKSLDKTFKLDIRYATANNFVGRAVYTEARAFLQKPAAEALVRVQKKLKTKGLGLVIFDGYRPWSVTKIFWDVTPEDKKEFVADPKNGSRHNRGCAVDLSLYNLKTGENLSMPSDFDDFSERAYPNFEGATAEQKANRELLRQMMESEGYTVYKSEWWHFDYKDWQNYNVYDIPFSVIGKIQNPPEKAKIKEDKKLGRFFDEAGIKGGIAVYDFKKNLFTVYDRKRFDTPFSPASTSKIIHSLIFLESGALKDENEIIKWDGVKRSIDDWNKDPICVRRLRFRRGGFTSKPRNV